MLSITRSFLTLGFPYFFCMSYDLFIVNFNIFLVLPFFTVTKQCFENFFYFFSDFHSGLSDSALYNTALSLLYVYNAYTNDGTPGWLTYSQ